MLEASTYVSKAHCHQTVIAPKLSPPTVGLTHVMQCVSDEVDGPRAVICSYRGRRVPVQTLITKRPSQSILGVPIFSGDPVTGSDQRL